VWDCKLIGGVVILLRSNEAYNFVFRDYPDVVNIDQMCQMLGGICTKTGYRLLKDNIIVHFKIGRNYKIAKLHIFEYLKVIEKSGA
jgi:oligoribonuclease NrnB/cAMP/cGMP phosphodiesterase (DHH superfamily)